MNQLYRVHYGNDEQFEVLCEPEEYEEMKVAFRVLGIQHSCKIVEDVMYKIVWFNEESECYEFMWLTDEDEYIDTLSRFSIANIEYDAKIYN